MKEQVKNWLENLRINRQPDEYEVKRLLAAYAINVPQGVLLHPDDDSSMVSFSGPYVVKVCSPRITHKTEHGGVRLNVQKEDLPETVKAVRAAFEQEPVLVEQQLSFQGLEFIVGALMDPNFGPAVMVGAGGIYTELYKDVSFRLAPCSPEEASRMLDELVVSPVFSGFRGLQMDADGLAKIISRIGDLVMQLGEDFSQLDINPIVYCDGSWIALDAQLILAK